MASILLCSYLNRLRSSVHYSTSTHLPVHAIRFRFNPIRLNEIVLFRGFNIVWALHFIITLKRNKCVQQFSFYTSRTLQKDVTKSNIKYKRVWSFTFLRIHIGILKWLMFITKHFIEVKVRFWNLIQRNSICFSYKHSTWSNGWTFTLL